MRLPGPLAACAWADRLEAAIAAVRSAGVALMELRGTVRGHEVGGGQLKTSVDRAAEGWVLGFLRGSFSDLFLAEEEYEQAGRPWLGARTYWTIDALDGTRSYVEGFPGFCVQIAYIEEGIPVVGVIGEPVTSTVYAGARGHGAWRLAATATQLRGTQRATLGEGFRFVDSTRPRGAVGELLARTQARFVECGSVGLKIVRIVEDAADLYAKRFNVKLWDFAPGDVLLREVGARLGTCDGGAIDYAGTRTHFPGVIAAPEAVYAEVVELLGSGDFSV